MGFLAKYEPCSCLAMCDRAEAGAHVGRENIVNEITRLARRKLG
jgi:hypothetical protein